MTLLNKSKMENSVLQKLLLKMFAVLTCITLISFASSCNKPDESSSISESIETYETITESEEEVSEIPSIPEDNSAAEYGYINMNQFLGLVGMPEAAYHFNPDREKILEMADVALELGTKIYKTTLHYGRTKFGHKAMVETAQSELYRELFEMDFDKYVLTAHPFLGGNTNKWIDGIDKPMAEEIRNEVYELTKYLLTEYKNSGKTFILQNWEADQFIQLRNLTSELQKLRTKAFIDWTNMIQDGVTLAREEVGMQGVWVMFAIETNYVPAPGFREWSFPVLMNEAFPHTNADLYSGSIWGSTNKGQYTKSALDYFASKAPDSYLYGAKNIYFGEFGTGESDYAGSRRDDYNEETSDLKYKLEKNEMEAAIEWGVQFVCYWQIYCNGLTPGITLSLGQNATAKQLRGVWLIRPDGTKVKTYHYFKEILEENKLLEGQNRVIRLRDFNPGEITSNRRPTDLSEFPESLQTDMSDALVLDFDSSGFETFGKWENSGSVFYNEKPSLFTREKGGYAKFTPELPNAGKYDIYIFNLYSSPTYDNSHSQITISHSGEETIVMHDARNSSPGNWVKIGTFEFSEHGDEFVKVEKLFEDSGVIRVAAIAFKASK